jgi:hypothetical protein
MKIGNPENLKGKLTAEVELANFNQKAKQQNLELKGILKHYENNHYSDNNEITEFQLEIEYSKFQNCRLKLILHDVC